MNQYNIIDAMLDYADTSLNYQREVSCFALPNEGVISTTTNNSGGFVEFDWITIKEKIWQLKKEGRDPEAVYMLHTHPPSLNRMSSTDRNMVYGWAMALGVPIWFLVLTENEIVTYLCCLNQSTKKVERDLLDVSKHEDVCIDLQFVAEVMYGASKADNMSGVALTDAFNYINKSKINWSDIHKWNLTRRWNKFNYADVFKDRRTDREKYLDYLSFAQCGQGEQKESYTDWSGEQILSFEDWVSQGKRIEVLEKKVEVLQEDTE